MVHMWADSRDELFAMADLIRVKRKWFQRPASVDLPGIVASWEHFDICLNKRALALKAGAVETDRYGPMEGAAMQHIRSGDPDRIAHGLRQLQRVYDVRNSRHERS